VRIAVTGSTGLIGSALVPRLAGDGHEILRVVRGRAPGPGEAAWDPAAGTIDADALAGVDAVVHLAARHFGAGRFTASVKREIRDSRVQGTALLAATVAKLHGGPRALVAMSGTNWYGVDRGDEILTEASGPGDGGFMPEVAHAWEAAADPARAEGIRVVHVRGGIVLGREAITLRRLLPLFNVGLGGPFGSGRQWWSWASLDDVVGILRHAVTNEDVAGAVNATAPNPVTNAEFTRTLARALRRPALLPVPRIGPRLLVGDLAEELLYGSLRVLPERTVACGYAFRHTDLAPTLQELLGTTRP
jgi:uncharacterized protein (TIGR01777 family)